MSINVKELQAQRAALVATIDDLVQHRGENDRDAETLSGLVQTIDQLLESDPSRHTWRVIVDTDYYDGEGGGGIVLDQDFTGNGEALERYVQMVVEEFLIGADDENDAPISTIITIRAVKE